MTAEKYNEMWKRIIPHLIYGKDIANNPPPWEKYRDNCTSDNLYIDKYYYLRWLLEYVEDNPESLADNTLVKNVKDIHLNFRKLLSGDQKEVKEVTLHQLISMDERKGLSSLRNQSVMMKKMIGEIQATKRKGRSSPPFHG